MKRFLLLTTTAILLLAFIGCSAKTPETTDPSAEPTVYREPLATIEETVLFSKDGIEIVATAMEQTDKGGKILVTMENGTDQGLSFAADDIIVNGLTLTDGFCIEAPAGETVQGSIDISYRSMDNAGITNIARVESTDARIFETVEFQNICAAPFSITTSAESELMQQIADVGTEVYNKDGIRIALLGFRSGERTSVARLLVTNDTEQDIAVKGENITVGEKKISAWLFDTVYAGTSRYCTLEVPGVDMDAIDLDLDLYQFNANGKELLSHTGSHSIVPAS